MKKTAAYLIILFTLTISMGCDSGVGSASDGEYDDGLSPFVPDGSPPVDTAPPAAPPLKIQAECAFGPNTGHCDGNHGGTQMGTELENGDTTVGYISSGDYLRFTDVDLTEYNTLTFRYAKLVTGGAVSVHVDGVDGPVLGTLVPIPTNGWTNFQEYSISINSTSGVHDVYLTFSHTSATQGIVNLDWIEFSDCTGDNCTGGYAGDEIPDYPTDTGGGADSDPAVDTSGDIDLGDNGLTPITNGLNASTTRYWDCCKPHCGWHSDMQLCNSSNTPIWGKDDTSACNGGSVYQCWDYSPIEVNSKVSYGWAAFNNAGTNCGDCFQLDFKGDMAGKQMIVQVINIGDGGLNSFDILIPGGGVGQFDACSKQWGYPPMGEQYGGFYSTCNGNATCIRNMCQTAFGTKTLLMNGCDWFLNWFRNSNNPSVVYKKVSCPSAITAVSNI